MSVGARDSHRAKMKKLNLILIVVISCCLASVFCSRSVVQETVAQTVDTERQKKIDWDKSITSEKLERLRKESRDMQDAIKKVVATHFPKLQIRSASLSEPANAGFGRKGQSSLSISWEQKHISYSISITMAFSPEEAVKFHTFDVDAYQLPEVYPAPDFLGKPAALTKNIIYNKTMTSVSIRFVRGRLKVWTGHRNHKQTANQNEEDLIEFARVIFPLLNAKLTIEEV